MNNEPVAYKAWHKDLGWTYHDWKDGFTSEGVIPLYTHPADESFDRTASHMAGEYVSYPADLTDEEIVSLINKHIDYVPDGDGMKVIGVMDFARAILKKASEK